MANNTNLLNISRSMFKQKKACIHQGNIIQPNIWRNVLNKQQNTQKFTSAASNLKNENEQNYTQ
jgi:hypothetical protein